MGMEWGELVADVRDRPGEGTTPLIVRRYRHPEWPERPVVRVLTQEVVPAEDARQAVLGFEPVGEPEEVGQVDRPVLGFPEWPIVQDPAHAAHATARMHDLDRIARLAGSRPKDAVKAAEKVAAELDATVPHFAPTFLEEAARALIRRDSLAGARSLFARARRLERTHGLPVDEERHRAVFLEFSAADALPAAEMSEEARRLGAVLDPVAALEAYIVLVVARTAAGGVPHAALPQDLSRLAKAAGRRPAEVQEEVLQELLPLPPTANAPVGFWNGLAGMLRATGAEDPGLLDRVLVLPRTELDLESWLDALADMGALDRLCDTAPAEVVEEWVGHMLAITRDVRRPFRRRAKGAWRRGEESELAAVLRRLRWPRGRRPSPDLVVSGTQAVLVDALFAAGLRIESVMPDRHREVELPALHSTAEEESVDLPHIAALPLEHPVRQAVMRDLQWRLRVHTRVETHQEETVHRAAERPGTAALLRQWAVLTEEDGTPATGSEEAALVALVRALMGREPLVLPWPQPDGEDGERSEVPADAGPAPMPDTPSSAAPQRATPARVRRAGGASADPAWWFSRPGFLRLPDWLATEIWARTEPLEMSGVVALSSLSGSAQHPHQAVSAALEAAAHLPLSAQDEREQVAERLAELRGELEREPSDEADARGRTYPGWTPEMMLPQARTMLGLPSRARERLLVREDGPWTFTADEYDEKLTFSPFRVEDWAQERRRVDMVQGDPVESAALAATLVGTGALDPVIRGLRTPYEGELPHPDASPADPLTSAPETVALAARELSIPEDAARYYLQLLALPAPKHTIVQTANGWTSARRKKAAQPLLDAGLVVQGRRAKAGRDLFLPGGWSEGSGKLLPLETWKRPMFLLRDTPKVSARLGLVVHLDPMSAVYPRVWKRVAGGDVPSLNEPTTGGAR